MKLEANAGEEYMFRERAVGTGAITEIFAAVHEHYKDLTPSNSTIRYSPKPTYPFAGELLYGPPPLQYHRKIRNLLYPSFLRRNNWRAKNLAVCGNFNLTNVHEVFEEITAIGQHPRKYSDTYIMLEQLGHRLDREVERLYQKCEAEGLRGMDITHAIEDQIDLSNVLKRCTPG